MKFSYYGRFLKRHAMLILTTAVVVALVAGGVTAALPTQSEATGSILLKVRDTRPLTQYDYDQFYVVQATDLYSQNVVSWLNSTQVRDDLKRDAKTENGSIRGRKNGGTIELTANAKTAEQSTALIKGATALITSRTSQLTSGPSRSTFEAIPSIGGEQKIDLNPLKSGAVGLVAGLVLGFGLALLAEAAAPRRHTT